MRRRAGAVLLTHIFTANPFFSSFVIAFSIRQIKDGAYGTRFTASLPQALRSWGYVDRIKLTLKRKHSYRGRHLSYINAGCPAPREVPRTVSRWPWRALPRGFRSLGEG